MRQVIITAMLLFGVSYSYAQDTSTPVTGLNYNTLEKKMKKSFMFKVVSLLMLGLLVLAACAPAAPVEEAMEAEVMEEEVMEEEVIEEEVMEEKKLAVGIVLPTKDEPRWIQD